MGRIVRGQRLELSKLSVGRFVHPRKGHTFGWLFGDEMKDFEVVIDEGRINIEFVQRLFVVPESAGSFAEVVKIEVVEMVELSFDRSLTIRAWSRAAVHVGEQLIDHKAIKYEPMEEGPHLLGLQEYDLVYGRNWTLTFNSADDCEAFREALSDRVKCWAADNHDEVTGA